MLRVRRAKMDTAHRAAEMIRKMSGYARAAAAFAATAQANRVSKSAVFGPRRAPALQIGNSKSVARNNRWLHLRFHVLRQKPPLNIPAECCQNHHALAPGPQKTNDD